MQGDVFFEGVEPEGGVLEGFFGVWVSWGMIDCW